MQTQGGGFRPPSRRLSRPSTAQRAAAQPTAGRVVHASGSTAAGSQDDTGSQLNQGLVIKGGRKVQSARPSERVSLLLPFVHKQSQRFWFIFSCIIFTHRESHKNEKSLETPFSTLSTSFRYAWTYSLMAALAIRPVT